MTNYREELMRRRAEEQRLKGEAEAKALTRQAKARSGVLLAGIIAVAMALLVIAPMRFKAIAGEEIDPVESYLATNVNDTITDADSVVEAQIAHEGSNSFMMFAESIQNNSLEGLETTDKSFRMKYLSADSRMVDDTATIDSLYESMDAMDAIIAQFENEIPLLDPGEDSLYYVAMIDTSMFNGYGEVIDTAFAMNNDNGEVVNDILFDKDTGIAYVPKWYYDNSFERPTLVLSDAEATENVVSLDDNGMTGVADVPADEQGQEQAGADVQATETTEMQVDVPLDQAEGTETQVQTETQTELPADQEAAASSLPTDSQTAPASTNTDTAAANAPPAEVAEGTVADEATQPAADGQAVQGEVKVDEINAADDTDFAEESVEQTEDVNANIVDGLDFTPRNLDATATYLELDENPEAMNAEEYVSNITPEVTGNLELTGVVTNSEIPVQGQLLISYVFSEDGSFDQVTIPVSVSSKRNDVAPSDVMEITVPAFDTSTSIPVVNISDANKIDATDILVYEGGAEEPFTLLGDEGYYDVQTGSVVLYANPMTLTSIKVEIVPDDIMGDIVDIMLQPETADAGIAANDMRYWPEGALTNLDTARFRNAVNNHEKFDYNGHMAYIFHHGETDRAIFASSPYMYAQREYWIYGGGANALANEIYDGNRGFDAVMDLHGGIVAQDGRGNIFDATAGINGGTLTGGFSLPGDAGPGNSWTTASVGGMDFTGIKSLTYKGTTNYMMAAGTCAHIEKGAVQYTATDYDWGPIRMRPLYINENPPNGADPYVIIGFVTHSWDKWSQSYTGVYKFRLQNKAPVTLEKKSSNPDVQNRYAAIYGSFEGAKFGLYTDELTAHMANIIDPLNPLAVFTAQKNGKTNSERVTPGTYYVKELVAPKNYIRSTKVQTIVVQANKDNLFTFYDDPEINNWIKLHKVSSNPGISNGNKYYAQNCQGAVFGVYDTKAQADAASPADYGSPLTTLTVGADGNTEEWNTTLYNRSFWLKELAVPDGYDISKTTYEARVSVNEHVTVQAADNPLTVHVTARKRDIETGKVPSGGTFEFALYNEQKQELTSYGRKVSKNGADVVWSGLPFGVYYVKETAASFPYTTNNEFVRFDATPQARLEAAGNRVINQVIPQSETEDLAEAMRQGYQEYESAGVVGETSDRNLSDAIRHGYVVESYFDNAYSDPFMNESPLNQQTVTTTTQASAANETAGLTNQTDDEQASQSPSLGVQHETVQTYSEQATNDADAALVRDTQRRGELTILKTDMHDGNTLGGVSFVLKANQDVTSPDGTKRHTKGAAIALTKKEAGVYEFTADKNGKALGTETTLKTNKDGKITVKGLYLTTGDTTFQFEETATIDGHIINKTPVVLTIKKDETKAVISASGELKNDINYIDIYKKALSDDSPIEGITMALWNSKNDLKVAKADGDANYDSIAIRTPDSSDAYKPIIVKRTGAATVSASGIPEGYLLVGDTDESIAERDKKEAEETDKQAQEQQEKEADEQAQAAAEAEMLAASEGMMQDEAVITVTQDIRSQFLNQANQNVQNAGSPSNSSQGNSNADSGADARNTQDAESGDSHVYDDMRTIEFRGETKLQAQEAGFLPDDSHTNNSKAVSGAAPNAASDNTVEVAVSPSAANGSVQVDESAQVDDEAEEPIAAQTDGTDSGEVTPEENGDGEEDGEEEEPEETPLQKEAKRHLFAFDSTATAESVANIQPGIYHITLIDAEGNIKATGSDEIGIIGDASHVNFTMNGDVIQATSEKVGNQGVNAAVAWDEKQNAWVANDLVAGVGSDYRVEFGGRTVRIIKTSETGGVTHYGRFSNEDSGLFSAGWVDQAALPKSDSDIITKVSISGREYAYGSVTDAEGHIHIDRLPFGDYTLIEAKPITYDNGHKTYLVDPNAHHFNVKKDEGFIKDTDTLTDGFHEGNEGTYAQSQKFIFKDDVTKLKVSKREVTGGPEIEGATLTLTSFDNNDIIDEWVSGTEPHYIEGLKPGSYWLIERMTPNNYDQAEAIKFTIYPTGDIQHVEMLDAPISIDAEIDKRQEIADPLDVEHMENGDGKNNANVSESPFGYYDYSLDFRSNSNTWTDEFTVEDPLDLVADDMGRLTGITTPQAWQDYDGKMNVWYKTNKDDERMANKADEKDADDDGEDADAGSFEVTPDESKKTDLTDDDAKTLANVTVSLDGEPVSEFDATIAYYKVVFGSYDDAAKAAADAIGNDKGESSLTFDGLPEGWVAAIDKDKCAAASSTSTLPGSTTAMSADVVFTIGNGTKTYEYTFHIGGADKNEGAEAEDKDADAKSDDTATDDAKSDDADGEPAEEDTANKQEITEEDATALANVTVTVAKKPVSDFDVRKVNSSIDVTDIPEVIAVIDNLADAPHYLPVFAGLPEGWTATYEEGKRSSDFEIGLDGNCTLTDTVFMTLANDKHTYTYSVNYVRATTADAIHERYLGLFNATRTDGHINPWLDDEKVMERDTDKDGRIIDYEGWKVWRCGLPTMVSTELDVNDLDLEADEYITGIRFEYGRVESGFTTRPDEWGRELLKDEHDDLDDILSADDKSFEDADAAADAATAAIGKVVSAFTSEASTKAEADLKEKSEADQLRYDKLIKEVAAYNANRDAESTLPEKFLAIRQKPAYEGNDNSGMKITSARDAGKLSLQAAFTLDDTAEGRLVLRNSMSSVLSHIKGAVDDDTYNALLGFILEYDSSYLTNDPDRYDEAKANVLQGLCVILDKMAETGLTGRIHYMPAILHMQVTENYVADTELHNSAKVDGYRNGGGEGLEGHDEDEVIQTAKKRVMEIGTTLTADGGKKTLEYNTDEIDEETIDNTLIEFVDTVSYTGLRPGVEYVMIGELHVNMDGMDAGPLVSDGKTVRAQVVFTPESEDGTIDVPLKAKVGSFDPNPVVAFEELRLSFSGIPTDQVIAEHKNIEDENQTVNITKHASDEIIVANNPVLRQIFKGTPLAQTGDAVLIAGVAVISVATVVAVILYRRRRDA